MTDGSAEVALVDDGSCEIMACLNRKDPRSRVIQLSRNFGHQIVITAGMEATTGDPAIVVDAEPLTTNRRTRPADSVTI